MKQDSAGPVDLWGDPWTAPRDPRGRKRHRRIPQLSEKVAILRAAGHTEEEIATRIGLSVPTLCKYYFRELQNGPKLARAVLTEDLWKAARAGKAAAARLIMEIFDRGEAAVPLVPGERKMGAKPEADEPRGKKAAAELAAKAPPEGEWGRLLN